MPQTDQELEQLYGPNWETVIAIIEAVKNPKNYLHAKKPAPQHLLDNVLDRFQPFSKEKLEAKTLPFENFSKALAAALAAARAAALAAARDAAWAAAWAAARTAALAAAWAAAWAAARYAARDAAWGAALDAAWDAAWAAARAAALDAAWDAARDAAWAVVKDKMPGENPFMAIMDLWLSGYYVYFDGNKIVAAYEEA